MKWLSAYTVVCAEMTYPLWGLPDSTLPLCEIFTTKGKLKLKRRGRRFLSKLPHSLKLLTRVLHLWTLDVMMRGLGKYPSSPNLNQWHRFLLSCPMMTERFMKISSSHTPVCNKRGCWNYEGFRHNNEALFSKGALCQYTIVARTQMLTRYSI